MFLYTSGQVESQSIQSTSSVREHLLVNPELEQCCNKKCIVPNNLPHYVTGLDSSYEEKAIIQFPPPPPHHLRIVRQGNYLNDPPPFPNSWLILLAARLG